MNMCIIINSTKLLELNFQKSQVNEIGEYKVEVGEKI